MIKKLWVNIMAGLLFLLLAAFGCRAGIINVNCGGTAGQEDTDIDQGKIVTTDADTSLTGM
jgi:hypothetical protein